jgi:hypothetical protein
MLPSDEARQRVLAAAREAPPFPDELRTYQPPPLRIVGGPGNGQVGNLVTWVGVGVGFAGVWGKGNDQPTPPLLILTHTPLSTLHTLCPCQVWYRVFSLRDLLGVLGGEGGTHKRRVQVAVGNTAVQGVSKYYNGSFPANTPVRLFLRFCGHFLAAGRLIGRYLGVLPSHHHHHHLPSTLG